jgi:hypothetical protein
MIAVEGVQTRVWTAGLEQRNPKQPAMSFPARNLLGDQPVGDPRQAF